MAGRPLQFPKGKQIGVLVSEDDYRMLHEIVKEKRRLRPDYSFGELVRGYIRQCLGERAPSPPLPPPTPALQVHALARRMHRIAVELERNGKQ